MNIFEYLAQAKQEAAKRVVAQSAVVTSKAPPLMAAPAPTVPATSGAGPTATPAQVVVTYKPPPPPPVVTSSGETLVPVSNSAPRVPSTVVPDLVAVSAPTPKVDSASAVQAQQAPTIVAAPKVAPQVVVQQRSEIPPGAARDIAMALDLAKRAQSDAHAAVDAVNTLSSHVKKALALIDQLDQAAGNRQDALETKVAEMEQVLRMLKSTLEGVSQRALLRKEPLFGKKKVNGISDGEVIDG
jgi:hypothetical protein